MLLWTSNYQRERAFEWQTSAESGPFPFVAASLWQAPLGHLHLHLLHADLGICPPGSSEFRRRTHAERGRRGFGSWPLIGCDGIGWVLLQAVLLRGRGESSLLSFTPFTKSHPMGLAPGQLELPGERGLVSAIPLAGYPGEGWPVDTKNPGSTRRVFLENVTQAVWGSVATN